MKPFKAKEHIKMLNMLKTQTLEQSLLLTDRDFKDSLKECGIPSNNLFWIEFKKSGLIREVEANVFQWNNASSPIHFKILQDIYKRYHARMVKYQSSYKEKKMLHDVCKRKNIKEAIDLLKENGFEIYAPKGNLYQKL